MLTFLEFYRTLMSFVNYKLYSDLHFNYPPKFDVEKDACGAGLAAVVLESSEQPFFNMTMPSVPEKEFKTQKIQSEARLKTLKTKITSILKDPQSLKEEEEDSSPEEDQPVEKTDDDRFVDESGELYPLEDDQQRAAAILFKGLVFFLNREVPQESLEFVIRSFGGEIVWENERDARITHHIIDRPSVLKPIKTRDYIQPQYIYDCVNHLQRLPTYKYAPNVPLPPHLSPFVKKTRDDESSAKLSLPRKASPASLENHPYDAMETIDLEEAHHHQELKAEMAGIMHSEYHQKNNTTTSLKSTFIKMAQEKQQKEKQEQAKLATIMMSKKNRKLYQRIQLKQKTKKREVSPGRLKKLIWFHS
jgi:pescadillo protein